MTETVRIGSRGSALARWQTDHVSELLQAAHSGLNVKIEIFTTRGDEVLDKPLPMIGGKGLFTAELEAALREKRIDFAVHSLKDLPTENPEGLVVGGIPEREKVLDVLVSRDGYILETLPTNATIGTSSRRRAAQLKHFRPDLQMHDIRGNVGTRIDKAHDPAGPYDAIVLAYAGVLRLGLMQHVTEVLPLEIMLPAPGQGALGIQSRDESASLDILAPINDDHTRLSVTAERAFLAGLGGGCSIPVAAYAHVVDGQLVLRGRVSAVDGSQQIEVEKDITASDLSSAMALGRE
ncbi:MAG: hydroxymethylbilane synthase, partial [Chloroflexi bacterium]|nr:hydroxymethylbilane synthase [Chloroflexota bacterium]